MSTGRECRGAGRCFTRCTSALLLPRALGAAALEQLPELARLGITVIELMPVADFPGRFGWGYDGVDLFAPTRLYGTPDEFRAFVDRAHSLGLGVILDVVYNHLGPDGNYLKQFAEDYFSKRYKCEWGEAINFDGENSGPVREFFVANAAYWIEEFHLDGLRLDATQQIFDVSPNHILGVISRKVHATAPNRATYLVAENEPQQTRLIRPFEQGGYGLDALWNDDFHHTAMAALTGRTEAYYTDYRGTPQEFISATKWGYLYQGQWYSWQKKRRGTSTRGLDPAQFINYLQNHDQIANSLRGLRCHQLAGPGPIQGPHGLAAAGAGDADALPGAGVCGFRAVFLFCRPSSRAGQARGRRAQGVSPAVRHHRLSGLRFLPRRPGRGEDVLAEQARFLGAGEACRALRLASRPAEAAARGPGILAAARRRRGRGGAGAGGVCPAVFGDNGDDRLLLVNLGVDLNLSPAPEPLLAPPEGCAWEVIWSSEDPRYGGCGTPPLETEGNWRVLGHAAVVLAPEPHKPGTE